MRRSRLIIVFYGCVVLSVACQRETVTTTSTSAPPAQAATAKPKPQDLSTAKVNQVLPLAAAPLEKSLLGGTLGKDGAVTGVQTEFPSGKPVYLTMWVKESPAGLQTSVRWYDDKHKEVAFEAKPMNGAKMVTFALNQKLKPGMYHVTGFWGGNEACDYDFSVAKAAAKK